VDHPQEVDRLVKDITALWLRYYHELDSIIRPTCRGTSAWAPLWTTGRTYMLQSDFCYMISPAMFEHFVLPDLTAICRELDYAFYHLDGKGEIPHLDMLLSIDRLRGIQWIPGLSVSAMAVNCARFSSPQKERGTSSRTWVVKDSCWQLTMKKTNS
jgi:hypothetical protein